MKIGRNTPDEMIAVIEAFKEGEEIEVCDVGGKGNFRTIHAPRFDFADFHYRVKREPRVIYVNLYDYDDGNGHRAYNSVAASTRHARSDAIRVAVKFVEVIE